jgi:preprotein translocase subunit YajC
MKDLMYTIAQAAPVPVTTPGGGAPATAPRVPVPAAGGATTTGIAPAAKPAPAADMSSAISSFGLPVLMIVVFYFLLIRPQQKREKEKKKQLSAMEKGDRVLTAGGIYGTIIGVKHEENLAIVKIADDVKVEVAISTLNGVINKAPAA